MNTSIHCGLEFTAASFLHHISRQLNGTIIGTKNYLKYYRELHSCTSMQPWLGNHAQ